MPANRPEFAHSCEIKPKFYVIELPAKEANVLENFKHSSIPRRLETGDKGVIKHPRVVTRTARGTL